MTEPGQLMTIAALQTSIEQDMEPPSGITGPLAAHWHVGKGNLDKAMELLKSEAGKDAAWVRAHLHRRKGEDDDMMVLAIAAGALIVTWIIVLLGSQLLGPR